MNYKKYMKEKIFINIGDRFNRLTVISECEKDRYSHKRYLCECDCGNEVVVLKSQLTSGRTGSCGCYQKDRAKETQTKHGMSRTHLYLVWKSMVQRCENNNNNSYKDYGLRGIYVCKEWRNSFESFYEWSMANGYREGLEIDRKNNNQGYSPKNCRWVERIEQANNKRSNIMITHNEKTLTVSQWSRVTGINDKKIRQRIRKLGWDREKAITIS